MKRTHQEILQRIKQVEGRDFFGVEVGDLLEYLPFEHAKPFLQDDVTPEQWAEAVQESRNGRTPAQQIAFYMPFAWDKANNCRGLSAQRSLCHMAAWLWLDGIEWADEVLNYSHYGKPQLARISQRYGIDWRLHDSDCWQESELDEGVTADEVLGR